MGRNVSPFAPRPYALILSRIERGWSATRLATVAGVDRHTVARAERGQVPNYETQVRIARALEADPDEFWPLATEDAVA